jgi:hypothetical protein
MAYRLGTDERILDACNATGVPVISDELQSIAKKKAVRLAALNERGQEILENSGINEHRAELETMLRRLTS